MISTKLASAVLETKVKSVKQEGNDIEFFGENFQSLGKYNIYEFVHKNIKDWLYENGHDVVSGRSTIFNVAVAILGFEYMEYAQKHFKADSEIEVLIMLAESRLE